jgi:hypothetical protein
VELNEADKTPLLRSGRMGFENLTKYFAFFGELKSTKADKQPSRLRVWIKKDEF